MKMKAKRASKATTAAAASGGLLTSPLISFATTPIPNKPLFDFDLKTFNTSSISPSKTNKSSSILIKSRTTTTTRSSPSQKTLTSISDLKDLVSSRSESLKRHLDLSHSEILKEFEASHSRLSKRFKIHAQTCQQVMDAADKEHKKLSEVISENVEAMKTSYAESIAKAEASANRVCKTSIAELSHSMEKAIDDLRRRHGLPINAA